MAQTTRATTIANATVITGPIRFNGFSVRESAGSPAIASVNFRDNNVTGQILGTVALPASGSQSVMDTFEGVLVPSEKVYIEIVAGAVTGVVYTS